MQWDKPRESRLAAPSLLPPDPETNRNPETMTLMDLLSDLGLLVEPYNSIRTRNSFPRAA